jgi:acetyl-CoA carboxylase biotin carboxyl carrier protein
MKLTDEDVREILRLIDESDLHELRIETQEFTLYVRKGGEDAGSRAACSGGGTEPASSPLATASEPTAEPVEEDGALKTIDSPMLGTFYRAPEPGSEPFVEVGVEVEADTIVCVIEVMKMMNSIPAGVAGTIVEVCPDNAQLVEYGAPLFRVRATS